MGKWANDNVMDNGLNWIKNNTNEMHICNNQPASYADLSTMSLGSVAMTSADFTLADGDISGRKLTVAAKDIIASADGTATHVVLANSSTSILVYVTTMTSKTVNNGDTVSLSAWDIELRDPQ